MDTQDMGRSPAAATAREPGASDNRLSLDPSEHPFLQEWEDGQEYTLTVKVTQVSPGEFEVTSAEEVGGEETPAGEEPPAQEEPEGEEMPMMKGGMGSSNPAVARLMKGYKS